MAKYIFILCILLAGPAEGGLLFGYSKKQLPTPSGLKKDVRFWESVFSDYGPNECLVHDSKNPSVVFYVAKVPSRGGKRQKRAIKGAIKKVKNVLYRLAKKKKLTRRWQRKMAKKIPREFRSKRYYRAAAKRLRCQRGVARQFKKSLKRSQKYLAMIKKEIKKQKLPMDLAYLPHLESGYNNKARSKVGALGLWQIMPQTARGALKMTRYRDERVHVVKATRFALKTLKRNYKKTKSWPLAVTAYNYGINGVVRAIKKHKTKDYMKIRKKHRTRIFRFAAKNFYPSFLAVRNLAVEKRHLAGL